MDIPAIIQLLQQRFAEGHIDASAEGNHLHVRIVSEVFAGLLPVKRQQLVYAALNEKIASGEVHAVHMQTLTPAQADG